MSVLQQSMFGSPAYYCERCGRQLSNPISMMAHRGPICRHKGQGKNVKDKNEVGFNPREWGQRFEYKGFGGCACFCYVQRNGNTIMATEAPDNDGTSITNAAEAVATNVCQRYGIQPIDLTWIEHYPKRGDKRDPFDETFDLVSFQVVQDTANRMRFDFECNPAFAHPKWTRLPEQQARRMAGLPFIES